MAKELTADEFFNAAPKQSKELTPEQFFGAQPKQIGLIEGIGQDYQKRTGQAKESVALGLLGQETPLETAVGLAGTQAKLGIDVIGRGLTDAGRFIAGVTPEVIKEPIREGAQYVANSPVGEGVKGAAQYVGGKLNEFSQEYPRTAKYMGNVGAISTVSPAAEGFMALNKGVNELAGKGLQKVGGGLIKAADSQKAEFIKDLVMPRQTPKVLEEQVGRTTEKGLLKRKVVEPTDLEAASINEVLNIKGVKKGNSANTNYNIIDQAKNREAKLLNDNLQKSNVVYNPAAVNGRLNSTLENLKKEPMIVGDGETTASRVVEKMNELTANKKTPAELLEARQQFDAWARSRKKSVFADDTAFADSVSATRQTINDFIAETVPDAAVKESLRKQSLLYRALDNIEPKAAREGKTLLQRKAKAMSDSIPIVNPITKGVVTSAGLLGAGSAAALAPILGVGGLAAYGAKKVLTSPITEKAVGKTLEGVGTLLRGGKKLTPKDLKGLKPAEINAVMKARRTEPTITATPRNAVNRLLKDEQGSVPPAKLPIRDQARLKGTKVVDDKGQPLKVYHGTPNGDFIDFKKGRPAYFSSDPEIANRYTQGGASSIRQYVEPTAPTVKIAHLDIKKPFDTRNPEHRKIFNEQFNGKGGEEWTSNGTPLGDKGLPDWTDGEDLYEFIKEKKLPFDGLILDEGATGGYGDAVQSRGLSYLAFDPKQIIPAVGKK